MPADRIVIGLSSGSPRNVNSYSPSGYDHSAKVWQRPSEPLDLTFAISTIEMDMEEHSVLLLDFTSKAFPPLSAAHFLERATLHALYEFTRNIYQLVVNNFVASNAPKHENTLITGKMRERILDQILGLPYTCFCSTGFYDFEYPFWSRLLFRFFRDKRQPPT